jgi:hypothetical protein
MLLHAARDREGFHYCVVDGARKTGVTFWSTGLWCASSSMKVTRYLPGRGGSGIQTGQVRLWLSLRGWMTAGSWL